MNVAGVEIPEEAIKFAHKWIQGSSTFKAGQLQRAIEFRFPELAVKRKSYEPPPSGRMVDRILQKLRKQGSISFAKGQWAWVASGS